ncbi:SAM-dependent methyltransferase [Actinomadura macrotermitis]|uniref:S-adenosyl methyltransferase n=1 Tax=Actinomadura macrotermitis TaxID=2585200 RepID=A0A7K0BWA5_9ACTN|nr:SAM-dependent methyltransferase [Actinomadura macrotermitis]MQY05460.1 hypothetical protein [Actinomadura macrotermitis]
MAEDRTRVAIDMSRASPARVYDHLLGGKDNYEADRVLAGELAAAFHDVQRAARANRSFVLRAVAEAAAGGITQFLDLGSGLPAAENVHEVARRWHPAAAVAYVDHDPVVANHVRALLQTDERVIVLEADLRRPEPILTRPELKECFDFDRPVAVLMASCLHFVPDEDDPAGIVAGFTRDLAPGSRLVVSHWSGGVDARAEEAVRSAHRRLATLPIVDRDPARIRELFAGFDLLGPGLADVTAWLPGPSAAAEPSFRLIGGIGRKPAPSSPPAQGFPGPDGAP